MKTAKRSFEDLECWKACREVRRFIYKLVKKFPKEELYGLVQDMRRPARSTTHNIAEGMADIIIKGIFSFAVTVAAPCTNS